MRKLSILILAAALVVAVSSMLLAEEFDVILGLQEYVEVLAPGDIVFDVTIGENTNSEPAEFKVRANTDIKVEASSTGFNETLNKYVYYSIGGFGTLRAGKYNGTFDLPDRSYTGDFVVNWDGVNYESMEDWTKIDAQEYTDTITFTVSAQ